jgi:DnaD/phage-associated family protein
MTAVKKEAFRWKRLGLDTVESAEDFLRKQQELAGREGQLLPLLGIRDRPPVDREREYIASWVDLGFTDDAIRLAYERTLFQKQQMNWAYMNSILKRWHQAGFHTAAQVEAGDKPPNRSAAPTQAPRPAREDRQQSAQKLKQDMDWMDEFLKQQEG